MAQFRKKPVVIEAWQVSELINMYFEDLPQVVKQEVEAGVLVLDRTFVGRPAGIFVNTLEGEMRAEPGDWIIRGVKGEFYPCKPDIFMATYDPVESDLDAQIADALTEVGRTTKSQPSIDDQGLKLEILKTIGYPSLEVLNAAYRWVKGDN